MLYTDVVIWVALIYAMAVTDSRLHFFELQPHQLLAWNCRNTSEFQLAVNAVLFRNSSIYILILVIALGIL